MSDVLEALLPADFRGYFTRDFKYLPAYDNLRNYFLNDVVYYLGNFYKMVLATAVGIPPVPATDPLTWEAVSVNSANYVLDTDIQKAMNQGLNNVNDEIFENDTVLTDAFYYCCAHFLVMDIRMAEAGLDSRGEGIISSKSVGSVSVSFSLPEAFSKDPQWGYFAQTQYGQKYLSYVFPRVTGRPGVASGWTLP